MYLGLDSLDGEAFDMDGLDVYLRMILTNEMYNV